MGTLVVAVVGCDSPDVVLDRQDATGKLTYAVGGEVGEVGFSKVECRAEGDVTVVELWSNQIVAGPQGERQRPRVLIARLRGDEVLEAHAFAPYVSHDGVDYEMLQMVAKEVPGAEGPSCRVEEGVLACNGATVVRWLAAGPPPKPSFKAPIVCP